ncbi:hypothetical protein AB0K02_09465 [Streptomyces sp. NPDC049597]|uniref:hypothetical protein n=1 Tax=Streptomyces sp. NPDC049597 TaxID=3155276 RepID=UPI00343B1A51
MRPIAWAGRAQYALDLTGGPDGQQDDVLVREWLRAGVELVGGTAADDTAAAWLRAVAAVIELKQLTRARGGST